MASLTFARLDLEVSSWIEREEERSGTNSYERDEP
jgi:hypothetical protein